MAKFAFEIFFAGLIAVPIDRRTNRGRMRIPTEWPFLENIVAAGRTEDTISHDIVNVKVNCVDDHSARIA